MESIGEHPDYTGYDLLTEIDNVDPGRNIFFNAVDYIQPGQKFQKPGTPRDTAMAFYNEYVRWLQETQGYSALQAHTETKNNLRTVLARMGDNETTRMWRERLGGEFLQ